MLWLCTLSLALATQEIEKVSELPEFLDDFSKTRVLGLCSSLISECLTFKSDFFNIDLPNLAYMDIKDEETAQVAAHFNLISYPFIVYFPEGQKDYSTYSPSPLQDSIHVIKRIAYDKLKVDTVEDLNKLVDTYGYLEGLMLGVYKEISSDFEEFLSFGESIKAVMPVALTHSKEIAEYFGIDSGIVVFRPKVLVTSDSESYRVFKSFDKEYVLLNLYGKYSWLSPNTEELLMMPQKPLITLYANIFPLLNPSNTKYTVSRFQKATQDYCEQFTCAIANTLNYQWMLQELNLGEETSLVLLDDSEEIYVLKEVFSASNSMQAGKIKEFVDNYLKGEAQPYVVSEEEPNSPYENNLRVLVGKTIDNFIETSEQPVVLALTEMYCTECPGVIETLEKLAVKHKDANFAKIDAGKNRVPNYLRTESLPGVVFISKEKTTYKLTKTDQVESFVQENLGKKEDL